MKFSSVIPIRIRRILLRTHQHFIWCKAIREFEKKIIDGKKISTKLIHKLIYGWGNQGFSAHASYLQTCIINGLQCQGQVLECGSGLTTVLLTIIAKKTGVKIVSLENNLFWADKVSKKLDSLNLQNAQIYVQPLKNYTSFHWYDVTGLSIADQIELIICDGPPAQTKGGRYGLIPVMRNYIGDGTIILIDDTHRKEEREVIKRWRSLIRFEEKYHDQNDYHAVLKITE